MNMKPRRTDPPLVATINRTASIPRAGLLHGVVPAEIPRDPPLRLRGGVELGEQPLLRPPALPPVGCMCMCVRIWDVLVGERKWEGGECASRVCVCRRTYRSSRRWIEKLVAACRHKSSMQRRTWRFFKRIENAGKGFCDACWILMLYPFGFESRRGGQRPAMDDRSAAAVPLLHACLALLPPARGAPRSWCPAG